MNRFLRKYLRKNHSLYCFIRYIKNKIQHILLNDLRLKNYQKIVKNSLVNINLTPTYVKQEIPLPGSLIEITNVCNLNCVMCNPKLSKRSAGFIKPEIFEKIIQQLKTIGINTVGLHTVGEPFVYKNLDVLFHIIKKYGFHVWLSTNGQFPERIEPLYRQFPRLADSYRFSIDGATEDTYEYIRKGGSFQKLIDSLEIIHKINKGKRKYYISLSIDSIISMTNVYELRQFFKVFEKYCYPENINFGLVNGVSLDPDYFKKEFPFPNLIRHNRPCHLPFTHVYFTYGGKVTLCCRDYDEELVIGDIQKNTIIDIWNNAEAESIRDSHLNTDKMSNKYCFNCYVPYRFISDIVNKYIHFMYYKYPQYTPKEFGDKVLDFLDNMNFVMQNKNTDLLKRVVLDVFT